MTDNVAIKTVATPLYKAITNQESHQHMKTAKLILIHKQSFKPLRVLETNKQEEH